MTNRSRNPWLVPLLLAAGAAGALAYYLLEVDLPEPEPATIDAEPPAADNARRPGPIYPLAPPETEGGDERKLVPLPALSDSDGYFRLEAVNIFGKGLDALLTDQALIEKFVATVDNLPRSHVAERLRPIGPVTGSFSAEAGAGDTFVISEENAARYAPLVDMIAFADMDSLVDVYRRYYPLFQEAYVGLGYPNGYFNDRVVEVIDHLLAAPVPDGPVVLVRPHVLYEYADPDLEALSAGQKMMLRMGPENAGRLKGALGAFRDRIAATD